MKQDYKDCIDWLYSQLPMFQKQGESAYHPGLENIKALLKELGNPEEQFVSVHVAGTNGKGSVSHMIASILQESGLKVGLYTSPHLKEFEERVRINVQIIAKEKVVSFTFKMQKSEVKPSFFEMTVALAFEHFATEKVDIAVIETGMGGRLDSTNVIKPILSVITNIGMDHQKYLGETLQEIAGEKAGIIKPKTPVVVGKYQTETKEVFEQRAAQLNSTLYWAKDIDVHFKSDLKGNYQQENIKTAVQAIQVLKALDYPIQESHIKNGLLNVQANTGLRGRYQTVQESPKVIADTGHNEEALRWIIPQLLKETFHELHMVIGMANDKDCSTLLSLLPKDARYYFCKANIPRGLDTEQLKELAKKYGLLGEPFASVGEAYLAAQKNASIHDLIFIGGSTFVVAEIDLP